MISRLQWVLLTWAILVSAVVLGLVIAAAIHSERRHRCHDALISRRSVWLSDSAPTGLWNYAVDEVRRWCGK